MAVCRKACFFIAAISALMIFWSGSGCSDSGHVYSPTLEGNLLQYTEVDLVTIRVSGTASCGNCSADARFSALVVEVSLRGDPTHVLAMNTFSGLGSFSFAGIRAPKGTTLLVRGSLYPEGQPESAALESQAETEVPGSDGETATVALDFL